MYSKSKLVAVVLALCAVTAFLAYPTTAAAQRDPFTQDPGDGCLGPDDPFCNPGGDDGNGGSGSACQTCVLSDVYVDGAGNPTYIFSCVATGASLSNPTFADCIGGIGHCTTARPCSIV